MVKSSKGDYKELKKTQGNFERGKKKKIEELNVFDEIYEHSQLQYSQDNQDEIEADKELIKRIKTKFNVQNDDIVKFMPQFIFAKNLRIIVKDRNIKQTQFEKDYDLGPKMLSKYINGHQFPDFTIMCKIAYGLDMSLYQLLQMSKFTSLSTEEINKITGLSENAMRVLFMLQHNTTNKFVELTNDIPISEKNKGKLNILNSFIEDDVHFLNFLNHLEQYAKLKKEIKKIEKNEGEEIKKEIRKNNKEIHYKLLRIKRRVN